MADSHALAEEEKEAKRQKVDDDFAVDAEERDDEETLDEEEFSHGGAAAKDEANDLAAEADMPLEQLLAMYGLQKDELGECAGLKPGEEGPHSDDVEEEEEELSVDKSTAIKTAQGWYNTQGPFAGQYEMVPVEAFRNDPVGWSIRYTVSPDNGAHRHTHGFLDVDTVCLKNLAESFFLLSPCHHVQRHTL
eukprot:SAG11_NODE_3156_length_2644_cov_2.338703_2_plen_191_part_00